MRHQQFTIATAQSQIEWTGRKITGAHNGTIALKEGTLTVADGQLTGGHFIADTTSIIVLDVTDPATNAQFAGHLASDDFSVRRNTRKPGLTLSLSTTSM
ncbi:hypothetical protein [Paraflavitalea speifideaquila]|uniref:hypothetical protein n=1 Tax=Paraflavitalea speifideaquila TaxID=3076558 RepID=UPI0028E74561|nr:hypothetical protein [Paraflavitalea speifideiaquila]